MNDEMEKKLDRLIILTELGKAEFDYDLEECHQLIDELSSYYGPLVHKLCLAGLIHFSLNDLEHKEFLKRRFQWAEFEADAVEDQELISLHISPAPLGYSEHVVGGHPNVGNKATLREYARVYWRFLVKKPKASFPEWFQKNKALVDKKFAEYKKEIRARR